MYCTEVWWCPWLHMLKALEPWKLGAGHTVQMKATRQRKALITQQEQICLGQGQKLYRGCQTLKGCIEPASPNAFYLQGCADPATSIKEYVSGR